jgi:hypothetical protein
VEGDNSADYQAIRAIAESNIVFGSNSNTGRVDLSMYKQQYGSVSNGTASAVRWKKADGSNTRNTSNCYMIKYPGYYTIPCAYGNSIYNDNKYEGSYKLGTTIQSGSLTGSGSAMGTLKRHDNVALDGNWMNQSVSGANPYSEEIVWQDVPGLITNVSLYTKSTNGEYYINFNISKDKIEPGNAVLAVKNAVGAIMWSWHIWVTPYAANDVYTIDANPLGGMSAQKYLKVPLGYVQNRTKVWEERKYILRLTQTEGKSSGFKTVDVTLWQERHELPRVSCCYYQWGRKDPFPGWTADETSGAMAYDGSYETTLTRRPCYNISNAVKEPETATNDGSEVGNGIKNPFTFFTRHLYSDGRYSNRFPDDNNYYDLWGTLSDYNENNKSLGTFDITVGKTSRKTIYDPCPPGFKVPQVYAMPAITLTGGNASSEVSKWVDVATDESELYAKSVNTPFTSHTEFVNNIGYIFYCSKMTTSGKNPAGGQYVLNAFGDIATDGSIYGYGENARYWSSSCWVSSYNTGTTNHSMVSMYIYYHSGKSTFTPILGNTESYGCPVFAMFDTDYPKY